MGIRAFDIALAGTRVLSYLLLAVSGLYLAMSLGTWYASKIFSPDDETLEFEVEEGMIIRDLDNQVVTFVAMPVILAAALGGVYEALWSLRENEIETPPGDDIKSQATSSSTCHLRHFLRYQFRPIIGSKLWVSVGEFLALVLWLLAMVAQIAQAIEKNGSHYNDRIHPCVDDPSRWCANDDGEPIATPAQWRLRMLAVFFGFMASSHFAVILIPVARDSTLWAAVGIPFERAVLYHKIAGHLAFLSVFLHALFFIVVWAWQEGWDHIFRRSMGFGEREHGGMSLPSGWMAFLCGIPMWITSVRYIRRRWYSLFKLAHWMFIGVLLFSAMHWSPNVAFFMGGLSLYALHVYSRLNSWKRWRFWQRWCKPRAKDNVTSVVNVHATEKYTRLVLRNPAGKVPRGGAFVYISSPSALGTSEAHAFTVALRGHPPGSTLRKGISTSDVHTLYIKSCGPWTKALSTVAQAAESSKLPGSLLVDVDGFYNHVDSFKSMMLEGHSRIVLIAGGSGMTCFMCFMQDWALAASSGNAVPDVRLLWVCRDMQEMELIGEAIPSIIAGADGPYGSRIRMELFCSGKQVKGRDDLSLTWSRGPTHLQGEYTKSFWTSLHDIFLVFLVGAAAYGGWLLGHYESYRRNVRTSFQEGSTTLTIMVVTIIVTLAVYRCTSSLLVRGISVIFTTSSAKVGSPIQGAKEEVKEDMGEDGDIEKGPSSATYHVTPGRIPTRTVLEDESELAKSSGMERVKLLVSGPGVLVESVLLEAREINWRLFDTEAFSFEF